VNEFEFFNKRLSYFFKRSTDGFGCTTYVNNCATTLLTNIAGKIKSFCFFVFVLINQLKYFNLAESNLDGSLNNSASSSSQPRNAIETCYPCAAGTWSDLSDQRFDKIYTHSEY
jgi:hypothetical protein